MLLLTTAPGDYGAITSLPVTFQPGERELSVAVQASSDAVAEGTEQFTAVLTNPSAGATLGDDIATVDIIDSSGRGGIKVLCQLLNTIFLCSCHC